MAERYDAAIIGAGADGMAAAILLARAGRRVIILERHTQPGGRLVTRQFKEGFFASPFADDIPPIPADLFWTLDLARHGARVAQTTGTFAAWPDRIAAANSSAARQIQAEAGRRRERALAQARLIEAPPSRVWNHLSPRTRALAQLRLLDAPLIRNLNPLAPRARAPWPSEDWTHRPLAEILSDGDEAAALMASALSGRAADPLSGGSALHLLAPSQGCVIWRGGLGGLGQALTASCRAAGAELALGREVMDIRSKEGRAHALALADGSEIAARAIISTLDLKRTFLTLFPWNELPKPVTRQISLFRTSGATARLLCALTAPPVAPNAPDGFLRGTIHLAPDVAGMVAAHAAWQGGAIPERLPLSLRFNSLTDPGLAPAGAAVMTVTISAIPLTPLDGPWSQEKRDTLSARTLSQIAEIFPEVSTSVVGTELIVPPDIEEALGATAGDLDGGEVAPDQMFAFRPFVDRKSPYTPVEGLYLAGASATAAPLGGCIAGAVAAEAVIADMAAGRLP